MGLRVVGAGLGRTGTNSLKLALEQLLDGPCYHMVEVFGHPDDIPVWQRAVDGDPPDWANFLRDYRAAVDWPVASFWRELAAAFPEAIVLLSTRRDADAWWKSASETIFAITGRDIPDDPVFGPQMRMARAMLERTFTPSWDQEEPAKRAYEAHNEAVRAELAELAPDRLVEWQPGDGWTPLCDSLGVPEPSTPFPHVNTTEEFRSMAGLDS